MKVRIEATDRLLPLALFLVAGGLAATMIGGVAGPSAVVGAIVLFAGLALVDGVARDELSLRQARVFLWCLAAGFGGWAFTVRILLALVGLPPGPGVDVVFGFGALGALGALATMGSPEERRWHRPWVAAGTVRPSRHSWAVGPGRDRRAA